LSKGSTLSSSTLGLPWNSLSPSPPTPCRCTLNTSEHQEKTLATSTPPLDEKARNAAVRSHILFAFGILLALALAWRLREVLLLVYVSGLFAVVLIPILNAIVDFELRGGRRISRGVAIALLLGVVFLSVCLLLGLGLPPVIRDIHQFATDAPGRVPDLVGRIKHIPYADKLGVDTIAQRAEAGLSATAEYLFSSFPALVSNIFALITALILCIYFMIEGHDAYEWFMSLFPVHSRLRLAVTLEKAELRMSRWLLGQGLLMLILGSLSIAVFGILHVRYFFLLGVLMGLFNIIPVAGAVITVTLVCIVAAFDSWAKMAGVLVFYVLYVNVENAYLIPRIMRKSVNLMGLSVLIALIAGTELAGVVGALIAVPTAALLAVLADEYLVQKDLT
jgi:predicted PurR-regulated permease PerM